MSLYMNSIDCGKIYNRLKTIQFMINFLRLFSFFIKGDYRNHASSLPWFVVAVFLLIPFAVQGQVVVQGTVTSVTGEELPGVNVILQNTTIGTVTDMDGNYSISLTDPDAVFVFSFIGYA